MEHRSAPELLRRELIEGAPDAIYTLDAEGRVLSANAAAAAVVGCEPERLSGLSVLEIIAPEDRERTQARISARFQHGAGDQPFVVDIIDYHGRRRTMEVTSRLIHRPGEAPRLEGFARDITDRKRAESALRTLAAMTAQGRGEDFFRSVARSVAEALRVKYALVGQIQPEGSSRVQTLAVWAGDRFAPNFSYDLVGTPCEGMVDREIRIVARDATARFPGDPLLLETQAAAFVGLPLWGTEGTPIGLLALVQGEEFDPSPAQLDMLRILAARAGAEIDRLRATDALRASEERFRQLAEQARDVLWAVDLPSSRLTYLSPSFERITGIATSEIRPHVRRVLRRIDARDRKRVFDALRTALTNPGDGYALEYRLMAKDESERWIFDQGVIIRDGEGRPVRISGVARDITARKLTEIALAEERGRFRELFENSPDAIFVESFEGIVLDVNQAACELHRLPRERLVGRHVTELAPEYLRQEVSAGFQRLASGEVSLAETLALRSDGTVVPVELRATRVVLHERRPALLLHVRNISIRKNAEEFLAGQKRILEWIATGRPVEDVLTELVRVTEARHHETRCWIVWFPDGTNFPAAVLAPTFDPASVTELAALAREDPRLAPWESGADAGPTVLAELLTGSDSMARLTAIERRRWASAVTVPVVARSGQPLGAFSALLEEGAAAAESQLNLYRIAASLAGVAIERHLTDASLREGAARLHRANAALLELARSELVAHGDLGVSLQEITEAAARGIGVSRVNIWLFEENDTVLRCVSQYEDGHVGSPANLELRVADYPCYFEAVTRDRFVSVSDIQVDARTAELLAGYFRPLGIASILNAGIRLRGRLIGMICLEHQGPRRTWKNEEELFAGSLADIVALAVQAGERRCIEEALRQSEEAYRSVVGALAEGVMLVNRDGSFVTFNDSAAEILGLTADYLRNHRLADVTWDTIRLDGSRLQPEEYPAAMTLHSGAMVTDSVMGVRRPDGRLVWISINSRPFSRDEDGQVSSVVVSFADITARQEAERALREGHELLRAVSDVQARFIENSDPPTTFSHMLEGLIRMTDSEDGLIGEVVWSQDGSRQLKVFAPGMGRQAGSPPGSAEATPAADATTHPILAGLLEEVLLAARPLLRDVAGGEPSETENAGPTTASRHLLGLCLQHDEEVVGVVGLSRRDKPYGESVIRGLEPLLITCANLIGAMRIDCQREQAEAQIRHLNAELEQRVEDRTADLRSTNEELAEFAYVVTHDLKAPLRGIHQLSEWLTQDHAARLDAEGLRLLGLMRGRVKHLQRMIDGLLACARVARTPEPESSVPTLQMVREVATVLAPPGHITIEPSPDLPVIFGNPDRLYQVFQNLLDNAVKYLDKPRGKVQVTASRRRGVWEFRVSDNGPGIPERYREKVFQIFQRLDPAGQIPGTGLGLTLVKRIVESRGGRIWIESEDGQGATLCFTWPDRARRRAVT